MNNFEEGARVYRSEANRPLIEMLNPESIRILDIGCGSGANAALINERSQSSEINGITYSTKEAELALSHMANVWVFNLESDIPTGLLTQKFDALVFSHILEHLKDPSHILARFVKLLSIGGQVLIAVPNVLFWRMRVQFLLGDFEYQSGGVLDDTHLRFFTYHTADMLLSQSPELQLENKRATGSVPLWLLRRHILPKNWCRQIDRLGSAKLPNLFGDQILISATKVKETS